MNRSFKHVNHIKLFILVFAVLVCCILYLTFGINLSNPHLLSYALRLRLPKLIAMLITAASIGGASLVFQTIIQNTIVTPCLLGMNSLYTLIHTLIYFFLGSASVLTASSNLTFMVDLILMGLVASVLYHHLFQKTKHNILYILLIGTVLTSFFGSIQATLVRVMDPNEYDALLTTLVASFNNINTEILVLSSILLTAIVLFLKKELAVLDILSLGKAQAINLGVDYERCIRKLLLGVALCIAVATAMVGPVSFLGLILANLARGFLKTYRHFQLILGSALFGMILLISGQCITERIYHYSVPISVFITIGGGIYFLFLLLSQRRI